MKTLAVILSGCGAMDGSEIHESVATLLAIDRAGARYRCFAPDILQTQVINHLTKEPSEEKRRVLVEAARIARCKINNINEANISSLDGAIFPGGFGAALNLSNFGLKGANATVEPEILKFGRAMAKAKKPQGFICVAPTLIPFIYENKPVKLTIGNDAKAIKELTQLGAQHIECGARNFIKDEDFKVATTPAYMVAKRISEAAEGIEKCVNQVIAWCN